MKLLAAVLVFASTSVFAESQEQRLFEVMSHKYRIVEGKNRIEFEILRDGTVNVTSRKGFTEARATVSVSYSKSTSIQSGLPVMHVLIGAGSKDLTIDYHLLLANASDEEYGSSIQLAAAFRTYVDGHHSFSEVSGGFMEVSIFDRKLGRYRRL